MRRCEFSDPVNAWRRERAFDKILEALKFRLDAEGHSDIHNTMIEGRA